MRNQLIGGRKIFFIDRILLGLVFRGIAKSNFPIFAL